VFHATGYLSGITANPLLWKKRKVRAQGGSPGRETLKEVPKAQEPRLYADFIGEKRR